MLKAAKAFTEEMAALSWYAMAFEENEKKLESCLQLFYRSYRNRRRLKK